MDILKSASVADSDFTLEDLVFMFFEAVIKQVMRRNCIGGFV